MHSITVSAYLPFYKFVALDRLWFAYILAMAYVDAHLLVFFNIMLCLEYKENKTHMEHQISIFGTWNLDQTKPNFVTFNLYASAKHATNCTCTQP